MKTAIVILCAVFLAVTTAPFAAAVHAPPDTTAGVPAGLPDESSADVKVFRFLNGSLANPLFDRLMPFVTNLDNWRIILVLIWCALVIAGGKRGKWAALTLIPIVAASDQISSSLIKPLVGRMRPCEVLGGIHLWYGPEGWITTPAEIIQSYKSSFAFPSSHAANMTAAMLFLGLAYRRFLVPTLFVAALISYSRIYIGVHWPTDVLAGMALGALIAWPTYLLYRRYTTNTGQTAF